MVEVAGEEEMEDVAGVVIVGEAMDDLVGGGVEVDSAAIEETGEEVLLVNPTVEKSRYYYLNYTSLFIKPHCTTFRLWRPPREKS